MAFLEDVGKTIIGDVFSSYFLGGIATVIGVSLLSKTMKNSGKACLVGVTKEMISFKQWFTGALAENKEFWQDVSAEAKHHYKAEVDKKLEFLQKQQELLNKLKGSL